VSEAGVRCCYPERSERSVAKNWQSGELYFGN
jgi:hypothetical protein